LLKQLEKIESVELVEKGNVHLIV